MRYSEATAERLSRSHSNLRRSTPWLKWVNSYAGLWDDPFNEAGREVLLLNLGYDARVGIAAAWLTAFKESKKSHIGARALAMYFNVGETDVRVRQKAQLVECRLL